MLNIVLLFCLRRDFGLHHALRGGCFHMLQGTTSATPDALHLQGLCRTSRRFSNWISAVIVLNIVLLFCLRRDFGLHHALRGACFHMLQGTTSATPDALHLQGLSQGEGDLHHALRGACFHMLQITTTSTPYAVF